MDKNEWLEYELNVNREYLSRVTKIIEKQRRAGRDTVSIEELTACLRPTEEQEQELAAEMNEAIAALEPSPTDVDGKPIAFALYDTDTV